jgi:hypothetical protein
VQKLDYCCRGGRGRASRARSRSLPPRERDDGGGEEGRNDGRSDGRDGSDVRGEGRDGSYVRGGGEGLTLGDGLRSRSG